MRPSVIYQGLLWLAAGAGITGVLYLPLSLDSLTFAVMLKSLLAVLLWGLARRFQRDYRERFPVQLNWSSDAWWMNGQPVVLRRNLSALPGLLVLDFKGDDSPLQLTIMPDSASPEARRKLRVRLMQTLPDTGGRR